MHAVLLNRDLPLPSPDPDQDRLRRWVESHDREALAALFASLAKPAYAVAFRLLGDAHQAEDAVQEGFLAAMRGARPGRIDQARSWVLAVVANAARMQRRAAVRRQHHESQVPAPQAPDPGDDQDVTERMRVLLKRLPDHERQALELRVVDGLTTVETARVLGRRAGTIDVQVHRALSRLRDWIGPAAPASLAVVVQTASGIEPAAVLLDRVAGLATSGPLPMSWLWLKCAIGGGGLVAAGVALAIAVSHGRDGAASRSMNPGDDQTAASPSSRQPPSSPPGPKRDAPWKGRAGALLAWADPSAEMRMGIDLDWMKRYGGGLKPTSVFVDPRTAPALAEVRRQFALFAKEAPGTPDVSRAWDDACGIVQSSQWSAGRNGSDGNTYAWGLGNSSRLVHRWFIESQWQQGGLEKPPKVTRNPDGSEIAQRATVGRDECARLSGDCWILGRSASVMAPDANPTDLPLDAPAWLVWDGRAMVADRAKQPDHPADGAFSMAYWLGPQWRNAKPRITAALVPGVDAWGSRIEITGVRSPLRLMSPTLRGCLQSHQWGHLATAVDPVLLGDLLASGILPKPWAGLSTSLTGEAIILVEPGTPLPLVSLVIGTKPVPELARFLDESLRLLGGKPSAGAGSAWTIDTPLGRATVRLGADRVAITTATDTARLFAVGKEPGPALEARLDMAAIRPWIPRWWSAMPERAQPFDGTLVSDGLESLCQAFSQLSAEELRSGRSPAALLRHRARHVLARPGVQPNRLLDRKVRYDEKLGVFQITPWPDGENECAARALLLLAQATGGAFDADRHVAVYTWPDGVVHHLFLRLRTGWYGWYQSGHGNGKGQLVNPNPGIMPPLVPGDHRPLGRKAADLDILDLPEQPAIRWKFCLPPADALAAALSDWRMTIDSTGDSIRITEHGFAMAMTMPTMLGLLTARRARPVSQNPNPAQDPRPKPPAPQPPPVRPVQPGSNDF